MNILIATDLLSKFFLKLLPSPLTTEETSAKERLIEIERERGELRQQIGTLKIQLALAGPKIAKILLAKHFLTLGLTENASHSPK